VCVCVCVLNQGCLRERLFFLREEVRLQEVCLSRYMEVVKGIDGEEECGKEDGELGLRERLALAFDPATL